MMMTISPTHNVTTATTTGGDADDNDDNNCQNNNNARLFNNGITMIITVEQLSLYGRDDDKIRLFVHTVCRGDYYGKS